MQIANRSRKHPPFHTFVDGEDGNFTQAAVRAVHAVTHLRTGIDSKGRNQWMQGKTKCTRIITEFLGRTEKGSGGWRDETGLWGDGLGLDSLEAAELSAMLEDEFGSDPFSAGGDLPETVGDIVAFYAAVRTE